LDRILDHFEGLLGAEGEVNLVLDITEAQEGHLLLELGAELTLVVNDEDPLGVEELEVLLSLLLGVAVEADVLDVSQVGAEPGVLVDLGRDMCRLFNHCCGRVYGEECFIRPINRH